MPVVPSAPASPESYGVEQVRDVVDIGVDERPGVGRGEDAVVADHASGRRSGKLANGLRPAGGEIGPKNGGRELVDLVEEDTGAVLRPADRQVPWGEPGNGLGLAAVEGIKNRREVRRNGQRPAAIGGDAGTQRLKLESLGADG